MARRSAIGVNPAQLDYTIADPETPAPVFALRAFKATIFGSPEDEEGSQQMQLVTADRTTSLRNGILGNDHSIMTPIKSPTKGILVTPGTRKTERKAVAFRDAPLRKDIAGKRNNKGSEESKASTRESRQSQSSPTKQQRSPLKEVHVQLSPSPKPRQTRLEKASASHQGTLEEKSLQLPLFGKTQQAVSESTAAKPGPTASNIVRPSTTQPVQATLARKTRSQSSNSTATSYRLRSERELRKLLHRYEIVKAYAKMKDQEANDLAIKVKKLEEQNRDLMTELEKSKKHHHQDPNPGGSKTTTHPEIKRKPSTNIDTKSRLTKSPTSTRQATTNRKNPITASLSPLNTRANSTPSALDDIWLDAAAAAVTTPLPEHPRTRKEEHHHHHHHKNNTNTTFATTTANSEHVQLLPPSTKVPNLPPDRLAAAKARLKIKAEERRKAAVRNCAATAGDRDGGDG